MWRETCLRVCNVLFGIIYFIPSGPIICLVVCFYYIRGNGDELRHLSYNTIVSRFSTS